jgi:N-methylhydantoinase A/oxoprolinase/acetone carboxylase beta subunit
MTQSQETVHIGIDIGGTFTDFVLVDERSGGLTLEKTLSTPDDLWRGIQTGLAKLGVNLTDARLIVHGTTVGLNAFLERKGHPTGLITTRGFRDVYEIGRHNRIDMYDLFYLKPQPLVSREYRLEVRGYVSREAAQREYGVVLHPDTLAVNAEATQRLRSAAG